MTLPHGWLVIVHVKAVFNTDEFIYSEKRQYYSIFSRVIQALPLTKIHLLSIAHTAFTGAQSSLCQYPSLLN